MAKLGVRAIFDAIRVVRRERRLSRSDVGGPFGDWRGDVRYVVRRWRRAPAFPMTIVTTLALSLGVAAAIFAFGDGYLFRGLPFRGADQIYFVRDPHDPLAEQLRTSDTELLRHSSVADLGFVEWSHFVNAGIVVGDRTVRALVYQVSPGFRKTVPLPLFAGRDFEADEAAPDARPIAAWVSYRFWRHKLGADPNVVGRRYPLVGPTVRSSLEVRIVGVLGHEVATFDVHNAPPDIVVPERGPKRIGPGFLSLPMVRLPDGVDVALAEARIGAVLQAAAPGSDGRPRTVQLRSVRTAQIEGGRPTARVFFAGAILALSLAVINVLHLMLTRGIARAAEVGTRIAIGASRWRVRRLFLTESALLGALGIGGGLVIGWWLSALIAARVPEWPTGARNLALVPMLFDSRVVIFIAIVGVGIVTGGGLWSSRRALRRPATAVVRSDSAGLTSLPRRVGHVMLAAELAAATTVMVGTVFFGVGIWRYLNQPLGMKLADRYRVYAATQEITKNGGIIIRPLNAAQIPTALAALRQVPGVVAASTFEREGLDGPVEVSGRLFERQEINLGALPPDFAATWGLELTAGRWPAGHEFAGARVVLVNQLFADVAWPGQDAVGQELRVGPETHTVIGVIQPTRASLLAAIRPGVLLPRQPAFAWELAVWAPGVPFLDLNRHIVERLTGALSSAQVTVSAETFDTRFRREIGEPQFQMPIVIAFGALAFMLAAVGVFGIVSYVVAHRLREFGIRIALGASRGSIWRAVIRESVLPAIAGLAVGIPAAMLLEKAVQSAVFGWQSSGWIAVVSVVPTLLAVAIAAAIPPARRAIGVDPVQVLRAE